MPPAIRIENVSKLYRLGTVGTGTISHDLNRWWHTVRGKDDPYAKVGQVNDRTKKSGESAVASGQSSDAENCKLKTENTQRPNKLGSAEYVWALRDISLEVKQGEILGIIGRNGAGKSTLLKLLSRVTAPTTGEIKTKGRIASLLEVGTGFHPELTGRENIYMNGSILGMRRNEIARQLDEIVEFSGCAKYLDTPVKRYSSGMTVRLGFAVAAHLQCEILIVDEVLAVGDLEFQERCVGRMKVVADSGRTVVFVSHNIASIRQLTDSCVVFERGTIAFHGITGDAVQRYIQGGQNTRHTRGRVDNIARAFSGLSGAVRFESLDLINDGNDTFIDPGTLTFHARIVASQSLSGFWVGVSVHDECHTVVGSTFSVNLGKIQVGSRRQICLQIRDLRLAPGSYYLSISLTDSINAGNMELYDSLSEVLHFTVPGSRWDAAWGSVAFPVIDLLREE